MSFRPRWRSLLSALLAVPAIATPTAASAQSQPARPARAATPPPTAVAPANPTSALDGQLLYQVLVGELALTDGDTATAYEWIMAAARRTREPALFRRAVDIALQSRAGEQALAATRAWRLALPASMDAVRVQLQILLALNRNDALAEPLKALIAGTPVAERAALIAAIPRFLQRTSDTRAVAAMLADALAPYRDDPSTRAPVRVAIGRAWLEAHDTERALALAREAQSVDPAAPGPALLAMELMRDRPAAEPIVQRYLERPDALPEVRLAYVRLLTLSQRLGDAVGQLETAVRQRPDVAAPYLSLGALYLELKRPLKGEAALQRYVELAQKSESASAPASAPAASDAKTAADDASALAGASDDDRAGQGLVQAWLMLAQSAEQRGDFQAAEGWLSKIDDPRRALQVQTRRASILARQGQVEPARELIRAAPERNADDKRAKLVAEASVLREARQWQAAFDVLGAASRQFPEDADLMYEQAMMSEKLDRLDEMERLLRRVIEIKPDNAHAHNALGYSLADRRQRLPEARDLIRRALELAPGDPFITDSLGWVEYRMGNIDEALRLLKSAYASRPDPEIAAHLGEVLWAQGQRDEARRVWTEARGRDAANDVLRETLARLRVDL